MRITFVQHGDMRAALNMLASGGHETYYAQFYSIEFLPDLAASGSEVTVISLHVEEAYDETVLGVRCLSLGASADDDALQQAMVATRPSHLIVRTPLPSLIKRGLNEGAAVFPLFADSFTWRPGAKGLVDRLRSAKLAALLNDDRIGFVANHNRSACFDLEKIGVRRDKIIAWDWPRSERPAEMPVREIASDQPLELAFTGMATEAKGAFDAVEAAAILKNRGTPVNLTVFGPGDVDRLRAFAVNIGVGDAVEVAGKVSRERVDRRISEADLGLVVSHHSYPEGLPGTIYEALGARLPLIVSNHPMFTFYFTDGDGVRIVPEKTPAAIADAAEALLRDPKAYRALSEAAPAAFAGIVYPMLWRDMVMAWLENDPDGLLSNEAGQYAEASSRKSR